MQSLRDLQPLLAILYGRNESEHDRLRRELDQSLITDTSMVAPPHLPDGSIPDVLRFDKSCGWLYVGDAKDAAIETVRVSATWDRVYGYLQQMARLIKTDQISIGTFQIITNDASAAADWAANLQIAARGLQLGRVPFGLPTFRVATWGPSTFLITSC